MLCEDSKGECNFGQHEINFHYADALRTADEHAIYKNGAKEIAALEGMSITFMAKYDEREGNSCHIHFSLADDSDRPAPLFARDRALFESFLAGQLAALRELTLLLAPNVNSYKRFAGASFAPTAIAWGHDNRTCALRVVGKGPALRFENRVGGADLNPYMALSAIIAAGLHGVEQGLELEPAFEGNAYAAHEKPRIPHSLRRGARAVRGQRDRARRVRRGRRRALRQRRRRRARGVRRGGHRLGAQPRLRAAVSPSRAVRGDGLAERLPAATATTTRCSRPCAPRPPSRRPSIASARRSSSGCCRRGRASRPSASCARGSASPARRCARR